MKSKLSSFFTVVNIVLGIFIFLLIDFKIAPAFSFIAKGLFFTFFVLFFIFRGKKKERENIYKTKQILTNIDDLRYESHLFEEVNTEYKKVIDKLYYKEDMLGKVGREKENYKLDLNDTYNKLLAKSTELDYTTSALERRLAKMSTLNAIGKAVLSELDMDKIISTILDSYFVLTGTKKIALYLWEKGQFIGKAYKGGLTLKDEASLDYSNIRGGRDSDYSKEYLKTAELLKRENEGVIVSELKVKGNDLGAVFIIENLEEQIKKDEMEMISALSIQVAIAINNAKIYKAISEKERLDKELAIAREIQLQLLPRDIRSVFGLEIANYFEPAKEIGGDYYDYFISAEGKFGIAIGDVSGKGMPAALLMTTIRAILKTIATYDAMPDTVMTRLNKIVCQDISEEMFVTLYYTLYDFETSILYMSNAGHTPLLIYDNEKQMLIEKNIKGCAVGFMEDYQYKIEELHLNYGDIVLYYTDGITEAENANGDMFGIDRLKEVMMESIDEGPEKIKSNILEKVSEFRGDYEQVDDITMVVIKVKR